MPSALVTGGPSGIGLAIARVLKEDGYDLTISSRRPEKVEAAAEELGVHGVTADVSREEDCERLVAEHRDRAGGLDVLVNSAGIGIAGPIEQLSTKYFDLQFAVNVRGLFVMTRLCLPMLKESRGWIVNLASIAGTIATPGLPAYGASKAAVISLTRTLNAELESDGVRSVAICPGFVDTPMAEWSGIPADEMIQPEDCGELVRFLLRLSPHARIPQVVIERMGAGEAGLPG
jgi:NAD(P)-dependent dehydrogenase (short-subunit alcohol dehydrogenase family)